MFIKEVDYFKIYQKNTKIKFKMGYFPKITETVI